MVFKLKDIIHLKKVREEIGFKSNYEDIFTDKQKAKEKAKRHEYYLLNKKKYLVRSAKQYKKFTNLIKKLKREVKKLKGE